MVIVERRTTCDCCGAQVIQADANATYAGDIHACGSDTVIVSIGDLPPVYIAEIFKEETKEKIKSKFIRDKKKNKWDRPRWQR